MTSEIETYLRVNLRRAGTFLLGAAIRDTPVRSGFLRRTIGLTFKSLGFKISTDTPYATYLHEGTGIYGKSGHPIIITPIRKKALHWDGIFAKRSVVKGIKPRKFFEKTLQQNKDRVVNIIEDGLTPAIREFVRHTPNLKLRGH